MLNLTPDEHSLVQRLMLEGEHGDRGFFDGLSDHERNVAIQILGELKEKGLSPTLDLLWEIDYIQRPPTIHQFVNDPYYLGSEDVNIWPRWKEEMYQVADNNIFEWILGGGIGVGKTYNATVFTIFKLAELGCLRNPQQYYSMAAGSRIVFGLFNVHKYKTESTSWDMFLTMVESSPFFKEKFSRDTDRKHALNFPNNVNVISGAKEVHALGENLFSVLIDEANFMQGGGTEEDLGQARELYNAVRNRIESRFMDHGKVPGVMCLVSSAKHEGDYLERHIEETREDSGVHISRFARWEVKPQAFCGETFKVAVGNRFLRSRLVKEMEDMSAIDNYTIIDVPIEYYDAFNRDIDLALRDIAGIATSVIRPLITQRERIRECVDTDRKHPFWQESVTVDVRYDDPLEAYFDVDKLTTIRESARSPRVNPGVPRYVGVDVALTGDCVTGDTRIASPEGDKPIRDLVGQTVPVYAYDENSGELVVRTAHSIELKRKNSPLVRVVTDGGDVRCTPDHKFMLRDGTYKEAHRLQSGDSLMPFYRKNSSSAAGDRSDGYEWLYMPGQNRWKGAHIPVAEYKLGRRLFSNECVHHKGFLEQGNKLDNRTANLEVMDKYDHWRLHADLITAYNKSDAHRAVAREHMRRLNANPTPAMKRARKEHGREVFTRLNLSDQNPAKKPENRAAASRRGKLRAAELQASGAAAKGLHTRWHTRRDIVKTDCAFCRPLNHKVLRVESAGTEDTYCMTVEDCHNFVALVGEGRFSSGVVVHNCLGFAMGHVYSFKYEKREKMDGTYYDAMIPIIYFDILLRVTPPRNSEIDLSKIRQFIFYLRSIGFPIALVSFDSFQSRDSMQILRKAGFKTELLSVDKNDKPYSILRQGILERRVRYYDYPPFLNEISYLEHDAEKKKVVKPERLGHDGKDAVGHYDVADAAAAVAHWCMTHKESRPRVGTQLGEQMAAAANAPATKRYDDPDETAWIMGDDYDGIDSLDRDLRRR